VNTYDKNGNLLSVTGDPTNTWDYNNRLTKSVKGTTTVSYAYDASGQRVKYTIGTSSTIYPTANYNVKGTNKTKHIFAGGQLLATISGSGAGAVAHSVATDHLTGANVVTSASGVVEELADYYPYGEVRLDEKSGTFSEQRKYAGQELDVDTGLSYMNARYYSGKTGRFISQDPMALFSPEKLLGDPQSLNSYAYARNNPLKYIDPTGEFAFLVPFIPAITAAGAAVVSTALYYAPQIMSFGQSLTTTFGQVGVTTAIDEAGKGNNVTALFCLATSGEAPVGNFKAVSSVWFKNPFERGVAIEKALGHNLTSNFPVIDRFENGVATSIKSLDLNAKTYQNMSRLSSKLGKYVDSVSKFNGATWGKNIISSSMIKSRALDLVIPNDGSSLQQKVLREAIEYGISQGVNVNIIKF
jgi:RHS repeat-associated protein